LPLNGNPNHFPIKFNPMKKSFYQFLCLSFSIISFIACGNGPKGTPAAEAPAAPATEVPAEKQVIATDLPEGTGATAPALTPEQASYQEFAAFYEGILPCKDCDGIKTFLLLNADKYRSYTMKEEQLGKSNAPVMEMTGTWSVQDGIISLAYGGTIVKYKGSEKGLLRLDDKDKPMDANKYFLKKL
jgi:uncharacterized lipoprotein NlpE involved in copper resistance